MLQQEDFRLNVRQFNITDFVFNIGKIVKYQIDEERVKLKLNIKNENMELYWKTDRERLQQILLNLLMNAVKFTRDGEIILKTSFIMVRGQKRIKFIVQDTGIGIEKEKLPFIFNLFESNKESIKLSFL